MVVPNNWVAKSNILGGKSSTPFSISIETGALGEICQGTSRPMASFRITIMPGVAEGFGANLWVAQSLPSFGQRL